MSTPSHDLSIYRDRVRGCLLGGAIGDALGYPIEFDSLDTIRSNYGENGITSLVKDSHGNVGQVSDDTQMTLFTVEGLIRADVRSSSKGICDPVGVVRTAYLRWLDTQDHGSPQRFDDFVRTGWLRREQWLYARRAPGNACLSGVRSDRHPGLDEPLGPPGPINPESKGCGAVMRSAPFGLAAEPPRAFQLAADCARITHGHPTGYLSAAAFAAMISYLRTGESLAGAVLQSMEMLRKHRAHEETINALRTAVDLAAKGEPSAAKVELLGKGWIGEEALAIAVYCALSEPESPQRALLLAVNHSGDSDSTGALCGNLIGTRHGDTGLPPQWLVTIEGRSTITQIADDFALEFSRGCPDTAAWWDRYPGC